MAGLCFFGARTVQATTKIHKNSKKFEQIYGIRYIIAPSTRRNPKNFDKSGEIREESGEIRRNPEKSKEIRKNPEHPEHPEKSGEIRRNPEKSSEIMRNLDKS